MSLIAQIRSEKLDIIGDVHGELEALLRLLDNLGYKGGVHPEGRQLVFVGDLIDRGPDSPGVIALCKSLVEKGAQIVLGNHEINLLQNKSKDGAGWYFERQEEIYEPYKRDSHKKDTYDFLSTLPLALESPELRVVHAAWDSARIEIARSVTSIAGYSSAIEIEINDRLKERGVYANYLSEQADWESRIVSKSETVPFLEATCEYNLAHQIENPLRVLTSGVEERCPTPFYSSGKWRFVQRQAWWDYYEESTPVVVGHYWRAMNGSQGAENLFANINPTAWHGALKNVFCVDYSVGARFKERSKKKDLGTTLAALRWPERVLVTEQNLTLKTENYEHKNIQRVPN